MSYTDMKWAQKVALNFSGTYSWQFILILHTGLSSLAVSSGKQIKAEAWGLQKTAYFSNMRGICTRIEESICARDRDLWDTSIFSRGPMHNKIKNKIKPESKKNPKPPPTPLEKVQKKKICQTPTLYYSRLMQGQWSCRTSCSYYVTWYGTLQVSSSEIFIRISQVAENGFFSQNYWAVTYFFFLYFGHSDEK